MEIKNNRLTLITLKKEYLNYLSEFDQKVPTEHKHAKKRPYTGILISTGNTEYVIPLTSPKEKHKHMRNCVDFHKIDGGSLGGINLNNILPVNEYCYEIINTKDITSSSMDLQYIILLKSQITWLNIERNKKIVLKKAKNLIEGYRNDTLYLNVKARCCNLPLLEKRCEEWQSSSGNHLTI